MTISLIHVDGDLSHAPTAIWDKGLQLPCATKYLAPVEHGLIAFLNEFGDAKTPPRAA